MNICALEPLAYRRAWTNFTAHTAALDLSPHDRALLWRDLTQSDDFHEWPVPMDHFVSDPWYIGSGIRVRPPIAKVLGNFWGLDSGTEVLVFVGGIGSGKSFSAALGLAYGLYLLSCLRKPMKWMSRFNGVSLSDDSEIVVMTASAAGADQSAKIIYGEAFERIKSSPYFQTNFAPYDKKQSELRVPHRVRFSPGSSNWRSALGWNVFGFAVDEAAFGVESDRADYVAELFNALNQRRKSRFGSLGFGLMLTSPGHDGSFVEVLARQSGGIDNTILVERTTTGEAKGELTAGTKVFVLDRSSDAVRMVDTELIFVKHGYLKDSVTGETVRYVDGDHPDTWPDHDESAPVA